MSPCLLVLRINFRLKFCSSNFWICSYIPGHLSIVQAWVFPFNFKQSTQFASLWYYHHSSLHRRCLPHSKSCLDLHRTANITWQTIIYHYIIILYWSSSDSKSKLSGGNVTVLTALLLSILHSFFISTADISLLYVSILS